MQRKQTFERRSDDEFIKDAGLSIDFDEIAKKGKLSKEEELIAKWFGIYSSRQPGNHMARIVVAGGQITSSQARIVAKVSEMYAQGKLAITTRQSIQLHWLKTPRLPDMMRALADEGLTTFHGCGDVNRNVAACPLAETCRYRRLNVLPIAKETSRLMADSRDLDNLPRKFKISFSGCGAGCGQPYINCVGVIAVTRRNGNGDEEHGFKVVIGGGMGWRAFVGQDLFGWVPRDRIAQVCRAVGLLFRDHGDRRDRALARLKFVVHRYGIDKCRTLILEYLAGEGVPTDDFQVADVTDVGVAYPDRPLTEDTPVGTDGKVSVRAIIPKGELTHTAFKQLAVLSEIYGDKKLVATNRQNIELHGIAPEKVDEARAQVEALGFATRGSFGIRDIVPCVGTTYCPKAVTRTRDMYDLLQDLVKAPKYQPIQDKVIINITGCPNSCSPYRIADIGLRGTRIREDIGSVEGYEIRIGGAHDRFGFRIGDFKENDCPRVVEAVLDRYLELRQGDESLAQCVERVGWNG